MDMNIFSSVPFSMSERFRQYSGGLEMYTFHLQINRISAFDNAVFTLVTTVHIYSNKSRCASDSSVVERPRNLHTFTSKTHLVSDN